MNALLRDCRHAFQVFRKRPAVTLISIIILALVLGANGAIFAVVNTLLFQPLPVTKAEELVWLWERNPKSGEERFTVSPERFVQWRRRSRAFKEMAAVKIWRFTTGDRQDFETIQGALVTANFFDTLGLPPSVGRSFRLEEEIPGKNHVVVLSHDLWNRRFGGDRSIIGKTITLKGAAVPQWGLGNDFTVIGIAPPELAPIPNSPARTMEAELWVPLRTNALIGPRSNQLEVVARLRPGVSLQQARAEMDHLTAQLRRENPSWIHRWEVTLIPFREEFVVHSRTIMWVLASAVLIVLVIACVNIGALQAASALQRRQDLALRTVLGATRITLARQVIVENLLLALLGGALGLLLASWCVEALIAIGPQNIPLLSGTSINLHVLGFSLLITVLAGFTFGLVPTIQAVRADLSVSLKSDDRSGKPMSLRRAHLTIQIALCFVLLVAAVLMIRTVTALQQVSLGFRVSNVLTVRIPLSEIRYDPAHAAAFFEDLIDRVKVLPGVVRVGSSTSVPLSGQFAESRIRTAQEVPEEERPLVGYDAVSPEYFDTLGMTILKGRSFTSADTQSAAPVVILNEALAARLGSDGAALGKRIIVDLDDDPMPREIIGIVRDSKHLGLREQPGPKVYVPFLQIPWNQMTLAVQSATDPKMLVRAVSAQVWALDPEQPITHIATLEELFADAYSRERFVTILLSLFAALSFLLTLLGIYGVTSFSVAQRTREIGVRIAVGATRRDVLMLVLNHAWRLAVTGIPIGVAGALLASRTLETLLFGLAPSDLMTFISVSTLFAAVMLLATLIPARRAARTHPMEALRCD